MTRSILDTWDTFNRWVCRYTKVCHTAINDICERGYSDSDALFLQEYYEINGDLWLDLEIAHSELYERISNKIAFLRGYLVDISFDGEEFMDRKSNFLSLQYPTRCNKAIGVWLHQELKKRMEAGAYFGFQESDVSFFCKDIKDVDLASMRNILPFDEMFLRLPAGRHWDASTADEVIEKINNDLGFDYSFSMKAGAKKDVELLVLNFTWEQ